MAKLLSFLLLFTFSALAGERVNIQDARVGDFIVYAYKQQMTLLFIREKSASSLVFEEISAPKEQIANWQEWVENKAPLHTSWTITSFNLSTLEISSIYSVDEQKMLSPTATFQFLPTLLKLHLEPVEKAMRKYIGPEPMPGEIDRRSLWLPKIIFNGKEVHPPIEVFRTIWPKDSSELSGKIFDLYFAKDGTLTYLPYWIEMYHALNKIKIMAIDSGTNLSTNNHQTIVDKQSKPDTAHSQPLTSSIKKLA